MDMSRTGRCQKNTRVCNSSSAHPLELRIFLLALIILFILSCTQTRPASFDSLEQNALMFVVAVVYANFQTNLNENTGAREERRRCSKLKHRVVCFFTLSSLNARTHSSPAPGSINRLGKTRELHKYSSTHIKVQ